MLGFDHKPHTLYIFNGIDLSGCLRYTGYMKPKPMTKVEINIKTSKWRFLDLELKVYSSQEWNTRLEAIKHATKYRKKHNINKRLKPVHALRP